MNYANSEQIMLQNSSFETPQRPMVYPMMVARTNIDSATYNKKDRVGQE